MQEVYWQYLLQVRTNVEYLDVYAEGLYRNDRKIRSVCGITSSVVMALWTMFGNWALLWGTIISAVQVFGVVRDIYSFAERNKVLRDAGVDMKQVFYRMEQDWYEVASGNVSNEHISRTLFAYKREVCSIEERYLSVSIVEKEKYLRNAEARCIKYFENAFAGELK